MRDVPVWKDEFSKISQQPFQQEPRRFEGGPVLEAAIISWEHDFLSLGPDDFAAWLKGAFAGQEVDYSFQGAEGKSRFVYNAPPHSGDDRFCDVMYMIVPKMKPEAVMIAREGLAKAIGEIDSDVIGYEGVAELINVAALLGMKEEFETLAPLIVSKKESSLAAQKKDGSSPQPATP